MAIGHWGSKEYVENRKQAPVLKPVETFIDSSVHVVNNEINLLKLKINELEYQILNQDPITKYIDKIVEVPIEKIVEKKVEVIKEFPVYKEKIITEFVDRPIEVIKEIEKLIVKEIKFVPLWVYGALLVQTLVIITLLLK